MAGAAALVVAEAIHPRGGGSGTAGLVRHLAAEPGRWTAWALLLMLAALLMLPGVAAWRHLVADGPGARLVAAGASTTGVALVGIFAFATFHGASVDIIGAAPASPEIVDHYVAAEDSLVLGLLVVVALFGFHLGWVVLFAGLSRAGRVSVLTGILGSSAALGSFLAGAVGPAAEVVAFAVLGAAIGVTGLALRSPRTDPESAHAGSAPGPDETGGPATGSRGAPAPARSGR